MTVHTHTHTQRDCCCCKQTRQTQQNPIQYTVAVNKLVSNQSSITLGRESFQLFLKSLSCFLITQVMTEVTAQSDCKARHSTQSRWNPVTLILVCPTHTLVHFSRIWWRMTHLITFFPLLRRRVHTVFVPLKSQLCNSHNCDLVCSLSCGKCCLRWWIICHQSASCWFIAALIHF